MITRAVTVSMEPHSGIERDEMWRQLHGCWSMVMRSANAAMREYFAGDPAMTKANAKGKLTLEKLPSPISKAAYDAARATSPDLPSGCISDLCQRVRARYMHDRWAVNVAARQSVPTFARPLPLSIRRQDWHLGTEHVETRDEYLVTFPLPGMFRGDRPTFKLILKTARDAQLLRKIADGEYDRRTLEIMPAGWERRGPMRVKVVYQMAEREPRESNNTLKVWTAGENHLLVAQVDGGTSNDPFHWNADWLRDKIIAYERWRHRSSEDHKHERRVPAKRRDVWKAEGGARADKHRNRVKTAIQQIAAQVIGRAQRHGCAAIEYDDSVQTWIDLFPWHQLKLAIGQAAEAAGIGFTAAARPNRAGSVAQADGELPDKPCADSSARKGGGM